MSSPPGSAQGLGSDELESRRRRVIERLQARHATQQPSPKGADTEVLGGGGNRAQFDELRTRVNDFMNAPNDSVDSGILRELEDALAILPAGLQSRRFREALNELKARLQQQLGGTEEKKAFSFSTKQKTAPGTKSEKKLSSTSTGDSGTGGEKASGDGVQEPEVTLERVPKEHTITLQGRENEFRTLAGADGREVQLSGLRDCKVVVPLRASAVLLKDLHNCTVLLAPVDTSIVVQECTELTLVAAAQQIRIHSSKVLNLHVEVRGALIFEDCDGAVLHPYRVQGVSLDWHDDNNWCQVHDFNWLSAQQSPHWRLAPEEEWSTYSMQSCEPVVEGH